VISKLLTVAERTATCRTHNNNGEERCPVACGKMACYSLTQACTDTYTEQFIAMNTTQECKWITWMRNKKSPFVSMICQSTAQPVDEEGVAQDDFSQLVQDRCQKTCQNPACTCADRTFPFWTAAEDITASGVREAVRERNCADLYTMNPLKRETVCQLPIQGVTDHLSTLTNGIATIIKVHYMCPKACGVRTECLCTDSMEMVPTPSRNNTERSCFWARNYSTEKLAKFCDERIEPHFARACARTCQHEACAKHDTTYSLLLYGDVISTSCQQIAFYPQGSDYINFMCGAMDYRKMLFAYELCPVACAGFVPPGE